MYFCGFKKATIMEQNSINSIYSSYYRIVERVSTDFHRYLYNEIAWDSHIIGIKGERGVGKTTLMLQHIKETFPERDKALYVSLDNLWFAKNSLSDLVEYFWTHGGTHLFLDEVHKYQNWQRVLKNIADEYPELYVVYTSSSMLKMEQSRGDMSRRQIVYTLRGLSFREFLEFEHVFKCDTIELKSLLKYHSKLAAEIASEIKPLLYWDNYLKYGYYPFYKRDNARFDMRLQEMVNAVLSEDVTAIEDVSYVTIIRLKKMLTIIAESVPQTPNMTELYHQIETSREQGLKLLDILSRAGLLTLLSSESRKIKKLAKPDKILIGNPNLMYAICGNANIGAMRETVFMCNVKEQYDVTYPDRGDFLVDDKYLFEVGGKSKNFNQIKDIENSFLAVDDTEIGHGNRVPLWMFGFLY